MSTTATQKGLLFAGAGLVAAVIVASLFIIESPITVRQRKEDVKRVQDLRQIAYCVQSHYQQNKALPANREALVNYAGDGLIQPCGTSWQQFADPFTGTPYEYKVTGETKFQLCAEFRLPSHEESDKMNENLMRNPVRYNAGHYCFDVMLAPLPTEPTQTPRSED